VFVHADRAFKVSHRFIRLAGLARKTLSTKDPELGSTTVLFILPDRCDLFASVVLQRGVARIGGPYEPISLTQCSHVHHLDRDARRSHMWLRASDPLSGVGLQRELSCHRRVAVTPSTIVLVRRG
jgi:hypothetical protein